MRQIKINWLKKEFLMIKLKVQRGSDKLINKKLVIQ